MKTILNNKFTRLIAPFILMDYFIRKPFKLEELIPVSDGSEFGILFCYGFGLIVLCLAFVFAEDCK